jgi:hypothetical protein
MQSKRDFQRWLARDRVKGQIMPNSKSASCHDNSPSLLVKLPRDMQPFHQMACFSNKRQWTERDAAAINLDVWQCHLLSLTKYLGKNLNNFPSTP